MTSRAHLMIRSAAAAAMLALAACGQGTNTNLAAIDNQLLSNEVDPALASAIEDQILVDPTLSQQSNRNAVRPPETPVQSQYPVRRAAVVNGPQAGTPGGAMGACGGEFDYGPEWANRMPAAFPAYPGGRVTEAAGNAGGACRVVTFRTADPYPQVLGWYQARATGSGFSAEHQRRGADHILAGHNAAIDGAFFLIVTPLPNGSDVALIVNGAR